MTTEIDWASIPVEELEMKDPQWRGSKVLAVVVSSKNKQYGTIVVETPKGELNTFSNWSLNDVLQRKPKTFRHTRWVNVYPNNSVLMCSTKTGADYHRMDRIACIEVVIEGKEGDGL